MSNSRPRRVSPTKNEYSTKLCWDFFHKGKEQNKAEEKSMEELANAAEDAIPDDGAIEIGSDEKL
ncbi:hypothetical protein R3P38DRAFT_3167601 [Favolaschia claudopus]|uniref:Uncharacterized protein n=1 Tax=Favolaschia claudopus TaxID=2862362 RepID=A0AAW0E3T5_9AGAR